MRSTTGPAGRAPLLSSGAMKSGRVIIPPGEPPRQTGEIPVSESGTRGPESGRMRSDSPRDLARLSWHARCSWRQPMGSLAQDIRYALRMMAKTPALTAVLAITLAVGIGASTTIFSVVHSVILKPLPYEQPDRIVRVYTEFHSPNANFTKFSFSIPEIRELERDCRSCALVGG